MSNVSQLAVPVFMVNKKSRDCKHKPADCTKRGNILTLDYFPKHPNAPDFMRKNVTGVVVERLDY